MRGREKRQNAASSREESYSLPSLRWQQVAKDCRGRGGGKKGCRNLFLEKVGKRKLGSVQNRPFLFEGRDTTSLPSPSAATRASSAGTSQR